MAIANALIGEEKKKQGNFFFAKKKEKFKNQMRGALTNLSPPDLLHH